MSLFVEDDFLDSDELGYGIFSFGPPPRPQAWELETLDSDEDEHCIDDDSDNNGVSDAADTSDNGESDGDGKLDDGGESDYDSDSGYNDNSEHSDDERDLNESGRSTRRRITPIPVEALTESSKGKSEEEDEEEQEAVPEQQLDGFTEHRLLEDCTNNQRHSTSFPASDTAKEGSLTEIKTEDNGTMDEHATSEAEAVISTTVAVASAASPPTAFTTEEMAELAAILAVCPPVPEGSGSSYHRWANVRWANWSLVDRVFYTISSRPQG